MSAAAHPIALLTEAGAADMARAVLAALDPGLTLIIALDRADLDEAIAADPTTRVLGFATDVIVPEAILRGLAFPAHNIHPASPDYPGAGTEYRAAYDGVTRFGATAHRMTSEIDGGPIIDVEWIDVPLGAGQVTLARAGFEAALVLLGRVAPRLARAETPPRPSGQAWTGRSVARRETMALAEIDDATSPTEFERRLRAFGEAPDQRLRLTWRGARFILEPPSGD